MLPSVTSANFLSGRHLGGPPVSLQGSGSIFGALGPLHIPQLVPTSSTPFLVESLLRERGYHLARPVATKPLLQDEESRDLSRELSRDRDHYRDHYREEATRHYLGLLNRPVGPDRLTPPSETTPNKDEDCSCDNGEDVSPSSPTIATKPPLKFSVTAILGQEERQESNSLGDTGKRIS